MNKKICHKEGGKIMENFKEFVKEYTGAIIGGLLAIIILCTQLYKLIVGILLIIACIFIGNYIQKNKYDVKEKLKNFIDKV